jgi:hypothetical protein
MTTDRQPYYNHDFKTRTENFDVQVDTAAKHGYFEHHELGDGCGGELWFADVTPDASDMKLDLIDYDGVYELPKEVAKALRDGGFIVSEDFD